MLPATPDTIKRWTYCRPTPRRHKAHLLKALLKEKKRASRSGMRRRLEQCRRNWEGGSGMEETFIGRRWRTNYSRTTSVWFGRGWRQFQVWSGGAIRSGPPLSQWILDHLTGRPQAGLQYGGPAGNCPGTVQPLHCRLLHQLPRLQNSLMTLP